MDTTCFRWRLCPLWEGQRETEQEEEEERSKGCRGQQGLFHGVEECREAAGLAGLLDPGHRASVLLWS